MKRRSREERRTEYLDAACELLMESRHDRLNQGAAALAYVRIDDVAARSGVSKGALYHVWPTQEAYWADLVTAMLERTSSVGSIFADYLTEVAPAQVPSSIPTHMDLLRTGFYSRVRDPAFFVRSTILSYTADEALRDHLRGEVADLVHSYRPMTEALLHLAGRELRDGVSIEVVITCLKALQDGLVMRHQWYPDEVRDIDDGHGRPIDPSSFGSEALLRHFSRPIDGGDDDGFEFGELMALPVDTAAMELADEHAKVGPRADDDAIEAADRFDFYLNVGIELLTEASPIWNSNGPIDALGNLRIADVAARVGVSKGSIYHLWSSQEAFRLDVLRHLIETGNSFYIQQLNALVAATDSGTEAAAPMLHLLANTTFDWLKNDSQFLARFSFLPFTSNTEVAEAFKKGNQEVNQVFGDILADVIRLRGCSLREPLTITDLMSFTEAALYGLCLMYQNSPDVVEAHRHSGQGRERPDGVTAGSGRRPAPATDDIAAPGSEPGELSLFAEVLDALIEYSCEAVPNANRDTGRQP